MKIMLERNDDIRTQIFQGKGNLKTSVEICKSIWKKK